MIASKTGIVNLWECENSNDSSGEDRRGLARMVIVGAGEAGGMPPNNGADDAGRKTGFLIQIGCKAGGAPPALQDSIKTGLNQKWN